MKTIIMNNCHMLLLTFLQLENIQKFLSEFSSFIKNLLLQNNKISDSIVKNVYYISLLFSAYN